jgi:hypothetical protein
VQQPVDGRQISYDGDAAVGACGFECGWIGEQGAERLGLGTERGGCCCSFTGLHLNPSGR